MCPQVAKVRHNLNLRVDVFPPGFYLRHSLAVLLLDTLKMARPLGEKAQPFTEPEAKSPARPVCVLPRYFIANQSALSSFRHMQPPNQGRE